MMVSACPPLSSSSGFLREVMLFVDCQTQAIGQGGYQALATPGSSLSLMLTGMLTIFVALFGYRMLFGDVPNAREGAMAAVKIGVVMALATSWPAYRTLAYDVALHGPAELAGEIGRPAGLPGVDGGLVDRLQSTDAALVALTLAGTGIAPAGQIAPSPFPQPSAAPKPNLGFASDALMLGVARLLYLTSTIGALASVRLIAGILLALGPLFCAFLLFEGTRGLFEGWVRGLAGAALGALGTAIILGVELAMLEPWLANLLAQRNAGLTIPQTPIELLVLTLVFALALVAVLVGAARVAHGFRLPVFWRQSPSRWGAISGPQMRTVTTPLVAHAAPALPSRAFTVSDAVAATQRREALARGVPPGSPPPGRNPSPQALARDGPIAPVTPLGQGFRRRTRGRVSASANRRDIES